VRGEVISALALACLLGGCAPYSRDISPAPISDARYDGWDCPKLSKEQAFVNSALTRVSADQDGAADHDALMVFLIGVPTSGGGVKGEVADLKGQQIALHEALLNRGCLTAQTSSPLSVNNAGPTPVPTASAKSPY
jgi:hypothetical protein